jgi:hypothetical protein
MSTTFASIIMSFNVTFLSTTPSKTRNKLKINVHRPTTAQVSSLCSMSLPDFQQGFAALHDKTSLLIFLIKCAKRFEELWRVWNKALVLSPPKQLTWIVTDAAAQTNSFLEAFCRTRQHSFSPTPKIAQNNCIPYLFNESKIKMQAIWQMLSVQAQKISP